MRDARHTHVINITHFPGLRLSRCFRRLRYLSILPTEKQALWCMFHTICTFDTFSDQQRSAEHLPS